MTHTNPPRKKPKKHWPCFGGVEDGGVDSSVESKHKREHGAEFADGKCGHERKWIHAADVCLAVGDIHGSPKQACTDGGEDAASGAAGVCTLTVNGAETEHDGGGDDGKRAENDFGDILAAGAFQFAEEEAAPENSDERVGVPQRKSDGETNVANGEDSERVGNGPEHSGEDGDGDQVPVFGEIGEDLARTFEQRGKRPARGERHRPCRAEIAKGERPELTSFAGCFGGAKPDAGGEAADHADAVDGFDDRGLICPGCCAHAAVRLSFLRERRNGEAAALSGLGEKDGNRLSEG